MDYIIVNGELCHYGVKGMKWGIRRYQNEDGSLTDAGRKRAQRGVRKQERITRKQDRLRSDNETQASTKKSAITSRQSINAEKLSKTVEKNRIDRKLAVDGAGKSQYLTNWGRRRDQDKSFKLNATISELQEMDLKEQTRIANAIDRMNINNQKISKLDAKYERIGRRYLTDLLDEKAS